MTVKVVQVDPSPRLQPYSYETATIAAAGGELILATCTSEADVIEQAQDAEIVLVSWCKFVTPEVMKALPKVRLIGRWGVGYDMIDAEAATELGIAVVNTPTYCGDEVAEHAIALLFAVGRRLTWSHEQMRQGHYGIPPFQIRRIAGRTLGIIGCGRIGSKVAQRAQGLGMRVIAYDKYRSDDELRAIGVEPVSFGEALETSDFISLHTPLNRTTRHLIDERALARVQPHAMIINTSRGAVIDQDALIDALNRGKIAAAGLDVFEEEPLVVDHSLRAMENVTITPHVAAWSEDSIELMRVEMCKNVTDWIETGWTPNIVNPEVRETLRPRA